MGENKRSRKNVVAKGFTSSPYRDPYPTLRVGEYDEEDRPSRTTASSPRAFTRAALAQGARQAPTLVDVSRKRSKKKTFKVTYGKGE